MLVSEKALKWAMRLYPPLFFQRVWVKKFDEGFTGVSVKISRSILNQNYNRSIFGGTIFCGADPFYPILLHEILSRKGYKTKIWVKRSEVDYIKPAYSNLYFSIHLSPSEIDDVCENIKSSKSFVKPFIIELFDKQGELCTRIRNEIYIRSLNEG